MRGMLFLLIYGASFSYADDANQLLRKCIDTNNLIECQDSQSLLWGMNDHVRALIVADKICSHTPERCADTYYISRDIGSQAVTSAVSKLEKRCEMNIAYCDSLADVYESMGNKKSALRTAKKYYDHYQKGSYPYMAYTQGVDVALAHRVALEACRKDHSQCIFNLRYMSDHPQRSELLSGAEKSCLSSKDNSSGATDCTIVGSYHFKNKNYNKAYEFWAHDCKENPTACQLILGADVYSEPQQSEAFAGFCRKKAHEFLHESISRLREAHCARQPAAAVATPGPLVIESRALLKSFLREQK